MRTDNKKRSKILLSICKTVGHIILKQQTQSQQMHQLSPECWLGNFYPNKMAKKIKLLESGATIFFRQYGRK